jgi:hypothetical protein
MNLCTHFRAAVLYIQIVPGMHGMTINPRFRWGRVHHKSEAWLAIVLATPKQLYYTGMVKLALVPVLEC